MAGVRLTGGAELNALGRELRAAGDSARGLRRELRTELNRAAKPVRDDLKKQIKDIPTHGKKTTGLRRRMAAAVKTRITTSGRNTGVRVIVDAKALAKTGQSALPALLDGPKKFRHPVFDRVGRVGSHRRGTWVDQDSHPYSEPVRQAHQNAAHDAAVAAVETIASRIERG